MNVFKKDPMCLILHCSVVLLVDLVAVGCFG